MSVQPEALYSAALEEAVIGAAVAEADTAALLSHLGPQDFYLPAHRRIWATLDELPFVGPVCDYYDAPLTPTLIDLRVREAARYGDMDERRLQTIVDDRPSRGHALRLADDLADLAQRRHAVMDLNEAMELAAHGADREVIGERLHKAASELGLA